MSLAYLDGKITVQELDVEVDAFNDLAELADSGEIATSAAIAIP